MEIDITHLIHGDNNPSNYSASAAERGPNAGPETWANAKRAAHSRPLLPDDAAVEQARDYFKEFGAWDDKERAAWSTDEVNALLLQYISGNLREIQALCLDDDGDIDWNEVERLEQQGIISGNIYPGNDGRFYFMMSH